MTLLTNVKSVCNSYVCPGGLAHSGMAAEYYMRWRSGVFYRSSFQMWGQLEFAKVVIEERVINPYEHGLLDCFGNAMCLPAHNGETVHIDAMP